MANFARVKVGGWGANDPVDHDHWNKLDEDHVKAPNFDEGSSHSPSGDIEIDGDTYGKTLKLMGDTRLGYESRTIKRSQRLVGNLGANFGYSTADLEIVHNALGSEFIIPLDIPHGAVLQKVSLRLVGAGGHTAGTMTCTPPKLRVQRVAQDDGVPTDIDSVDDTTTTATYEAWHTLEVTGMGETIDLTTYRYQIELEGEVGGDGQTGAKYNMLWTECDVTEQPEY